MKSSTYSPPSLKNKTLSHIFNTQKTCQHRRIKGKNYDIDRLDANSFIVLSKKSRDFFVKKKIIDRLIFFSKKQQSVPFWNTLLLHIDTIWYKMKQLFVTFVSFMRKLVTGELPLLLFSKTSLLSFKKENNPVRI